MNKCEQARVSLAGRLLLVMVNPERLSRRQDDGSSQTPCKSSNGFPVCRLTSPQLGVSNRIRDRRLTIED